MTSSDTISLHLVEEQLTAGRLRLGFSPSLEKRFQTDSRATQAKRLIISTIGACIIYDAYLILDYLMFPDMFVALLVSRLGIITGAAFAYIYLVHRNSAKYFSKIPITFTSMAAIFLDLALHSYSNSGYAADFYYCGITVLIYFSVVVRPSFRTVAWFLVATISMLTVYFSRSGDLNSYQILAHVSQYVTTGLFLGFASYTLEQSSRQNYLLGLSSSLLNEQLERAASIDLLTGLGNRRMFESVSQQYWTAAPDGTAAVILLDIDRFKLFNDSYGHLAGDNCLAAIGRALTARLRSPGDIAIRFGGEEMLFLLPDTDLHGAVAIAEDLRCAIRALQIPHPALAEGATVTASFGVAAARTADVDPTDLIAMADTALYAAKRAGRDRVWPPKEDAAARCDGDLAVLFDARKIELCA